MTEIDKEKILSIVEEAVKASLQTSKYVPITAKSKETPVTINLTKEFNIKINP